MARARLRFNPDTVFVEISTICRRYGVGVVYADMHSFDALGTIAYRHKLTLAPEPPTANRKLAMYEGLAARLADGEIELPPHPQLRADLLNVRRRITPNGVSIVLVDTPDGRHSDFAPSVAMAIEKSMASPPHPTRKLTTEEMLNAEAERLERMAVERVDEALRLKREARGFESDCLGTFWGAGE